MRIGCPFTHTGVGLAEFANRSGSSSGSLLEVVVCNTICEAQLSWSHTNSTRHKILGGRFGSGLGASIRWMFDRE